MVTAKLFRNGRSQAVRLPKQFAIQGDEVYIKKVDGIVMLIPKSTDAWSSFVASLDKFSGDIFENGRNQGVLERRGPLG